MAASIKRLDSNQNCQLKRLFKDEPKFSSFCIDKSRKLQCNVCQFQLNYRDVDILKRHLNSARHRTHVKLNRFELFYNKWCDDKT